jgi:hypothetical protein
MNYILEKAKEYTENIWVKLLSVIPPCFLFMDEKEKIMVFSLLIIISIDCIFGAMRAKYVKDDFEFSILGAKFSKKFLLLFFTMTASFIISNAYDVFGWWFYVIGSILTFSEFGSLLKKSKDLGLPIKSEYIDILNNKIDKCIKGFLK